MIRTAIAFALLFSGCVNPSEDKLRTATDSLPASRSSKPATVFADTSTAPKPPPMESVPFILTPQEVKDDSVFDDGSIPTSWENAGISDPVGLKLFIKQLKDWVKNNQKDSVGSVLAYPLLNPPIRNNAQFLANYDDYFNDTVKRSLASQNLSQIFRRDQGVMIGNGELWIRQTEKGFRIVTINN